QKTILFSIVLLTVSIYILKNQKWKLGLTKFYSYLVLGSVLLYSISNYLMTIAIVPVRQFIIPAQISFAHYEFFSTNEKLYFAEGMIVKLFNIESPYPILSTYLIAEERSNWNTGFLADAYDNGGFFLMIIFTLICAAILLFVDSVSIKSTSRYEYTALMVYSVIILNDGALLTTLFTWGLAFLLFFIYIKASEDYTLSQSVKNKYILK